MATGEIRRAFFKHKVFGELIAVEIDERGYVYAVSRPITAADACKHRLPEYTLDMGPAEGAGDQELSAVSVNKHRSDWELFEPLCSDPVHQLHEIFEADRETDAAEAIWTSRAEDAKAAKSVFEKCQERARALRRELRDPARLPLFDRPQGGEKPAPGAAA